MKRLKSNNAGNADAKHGGRREWKCFASPTDLAHQRAGWLRQAVMNRTPSQFFQLEAGWIPAPGRPVPRSDKRLLDVRE
jgi:hypothetical protein